MFRHESKTNSESRTTLGMIQFRDRIINKSTVSQALPDVSLSCLISQDRALGNYSAETYKVYTRLKQMTTFTSK